MLCIAHGILVFVGGRHFRHSGPSPTLGSIGPLTNGATSPGYYSCFSLYPWCFGHSLWRGVQHQALVSKLQRMQIFIGMRQRICFGSIHDIGVLLVQVDFKDATAKISLLLSFTTHLNKLKCTFKPFEMNLLTESKFECKLDT